MWSKVTEIVLKLFSAMMVWKSGRDSHKLDQMEKAYEIRKKQLKVKRDNHKSFVDRLRNGGE